MWDLAFSKDPQQEYIHLADGLDEQVSIMRCGTLEVVTSFDDGGRWPGTLFGVHGFAIDSKGNIYASERGEGKRVQRFFYKRLGPVAAAI